MIGIWIVIIGLLLSGLAGAAFFIISSTTKRMAVIGSVCSIAAGLIIAALPFWWLYWTESGERMQKTFHSNTTGGLYRTVEVYDVKGNLIKSYEGKFDVQESQNNGVVKVKFDLNGKRHIIYSQTGTVLIDEVQGE